MAAGLVCDECSRSWTGCRGAVAIGVVPRHPFRSTRLHAAVQVPCGHCEARAQEPCRGALGGHTIQTHAVRRKAFTVARRRGRLPQPAVSVPDEPGPYESAARELETIARAFREKAQAAQAAQAKRLAKRRRPAVR